MFENERKEMVDGQIIARGITHEKIAAAMKSIPRHTFIPKELWDQAYEDHPVPIGFGQTISQPYIVALMLELVEPSQEKRCLEVGSGSGYLLAIASKLYKEVIGVESVQGLVEKSRRSLSYVRSDTVQVFCADGYEGCTGEFDSIIISCSCSHVPVPLLEQLAVGGILVAPIGDSLSQELIVMRKDLEGKITCESHGGVRFVPLISEHDE